jgi:aminoglycoside phosphotransferase (APT) family kinase protein
MEARYSAFLEEGANIRSAPSLLHADLWPEQALVLPEGRLAGVIDHSYVSIGEPNYDLSYLAAHIGPDFLTGLLRYLPHHDASRLT